MYRHLLRWLAPFLLLFTCMLGPLAAQPGPAPGGQPREDVARGVNQMSGEVPTESSGHNPGPAYVFAVLAALLVLVVVCMPSRKA